MLHRIGSFVLALAFATVAHAGSVIFTDTFEGGVNSAGWTYGPPQNLPASGGNPGAYLKATMDTFAPSLRTNSPSSAFTGDYRSSKVTSIGVDLRTLATQFAFSREATLVLWSGTCAVYRLGTDFVPQVNQGWKPIDVPVPSQSATMPSGWAVHPSSTCLQPNATWNQVITNVTKVEFFYGDPTFFFIFDIWTVGADNIRITRDLDWTDLGHALAGTSGLPTLSGTGALSAGSNVTISLANARPNSAALLITGLSQLNQPFLGGVLVPNVASTNFVLPIQTNGAGAISLPTTWPAGVPSGTPIVLQYWIADPVAVFGAAASNGLQGIAN